MVQPFAFSSLSFRVSATRGRLSSLSRPSSFHSPFASAWGCISVGEGRRDPHGLLLSRSGRQGGWPPASLRLVPRSVRGWVAASGVEWCALWGRGVARACVPRVAFQSRPPNPPLRILWSSILRRAFSVRSCLLPHLHCRFSEEQRDLRMLGLASLVVGLGFGLRIQECSVGWVWGVWCRIGI